MEQLEAMHFLLPFLRLDKFDSCDDATDGQEEDKSGHCNPHRRMYIVLDEHELKVTNQSVNKRRNEDNRAADPVQPHMHLPLVL